MAVLASNFWYQYDFLAKALAVATGPWVPHHLHSWTHSCHICALKMLQVDPDAILFPERLRGHVAPHVGQPGPKNAVLIENAAWKILKLRCSQCFRWGMSFFLTARYTSRPCMELLRPFNLKDTENLHFFSRFMSIYVVKWRFCYCWCVFVWDIWDIRFVHEPLFFKNFSTV